jgi:hypothetical protein
LIRHHVANLHIEVSGPLSASGAAYFFVVTERGPDHWGRYRDRYVCRDGDWRFAHRRVRLDGRAPDAKLGGSAATPPATVRQRRERR